MNVRQLKTDPNFESVGQAAAGVVEKTAKGKDQYAWWRSAMEMGGGRQLTREQSIALGVTDDPQAGFYRKRDKGGRDIPVAIWNDEMGLVALAGSSPVDPVDVWSWVCAWPIAHETYEAVSNGEAWPDEPPVAKAVIGHNQPDDPHEAAKFEFEGEKETAEDFLKKPIASQKDADQAAVWAKRLNDLYGKVDRMFRAKKDPIVQAGKEIDEEYRWRQEIKDLATALKRHQDDWLREQDRLEQERQRRAREEADRIAREAEEARIAAEKAAAKKVAAGMEDAAAIAEQNRLREDAERRAAEAAAAEREAQARKVSAGRTGAKVSLRTYVSARIVDYDKALVALKDHPDMRALVEQLANRAVKAGVHVDGVERFEEKRAA